jgi:ketosteroid isomerase-like protein
MEARVSIETHKQIVLEMIADFVDPKYLTDDFEFSIEADPTSHAAAAKTQSASELVKGWGRTKDIFRHPGEGETPGGLRQTVRSITAEGDRVIVEALGEGVLKTDSARMVKNRAALVYEFQGEKIAKLRVYEDTAFVQAFWKDQNRDIVDAALKE